MLRSLDSLVRTWTFWTFGSGILDPALAPAPDPAIFVIDLQDVNKELFFLSFSAYHFLRVYLHHFSKIKSHKEVTNSRNQGFSYYFCVTIDGSGSAVAIPLTN